MNDNRGLIENFLEAKYAEEGLSENSISAYSRDLEKVSVKLNNAFSGTCMSGEFSTATTILRMV